MRLIGARHRAGRVTLLLLILGLTAPMALSAAAAVSIPVLNVDIWPEHDDPRVLVIYRGELSSDAPLPYTLSFEIPASGQVNAAAYRATDGSLISAQYEYRQDGSRLWVTFTIPERGFQFEYYADLIARRPQRAFTVGVVFPLPVGVMRVSVEQPMRSSAFTVTPAAGGTTQTTLGFTHHLYTVTGWPAGRVWTVRATYRKADENPSIPRVVRPPQPAGGSPAPFGARATPLWVWAAIAAAALGVASIGAFLVLQRRERSGRAPAVAAAQGTSKRDRRPDASPPVHCTNCGHRARPGDRFCGRCGQPLRGA
ncbi:MAG: zinc ribbon domain-containing protein [Armatimonadota bacterium]|nr:zinc ribbon domain-containing protein [Armatimonadota bacterium]